MSRDIFYRHESELALVGCLVWGNQESVHEILEAVRYEDLTHVFAQNAVKVCRHLLEQGQNVDLVTVGRAWEPVTGEKAPLADMSEAMDKSPSPSNWPYYAEDIRDSAERRALRVLASEIHTASGDATKPVEETKSRAENGILERFSGSGGIHTARDVMRELVDDLDARRQRKGQLSGISYGIPLLDHMTDGIQQGEIILVGARPSIGKTAMGVTLAANIAVHGQIPTLFLTLETPRLGIMRRFAANVSGVDIRSMIRGEMEEQDMRRVTTTAVKIAKSPLWIHDGTSGMTGLECASTMRRAIRKHGVRVVVVDYIQRIKVSGTAEKRTYGIAENSELLCQVAKSTGCSLIVTAQLNRAAEEDKRPSMKDIGESGQLEKDADVIMLLHRERAEKIGPAEGLIVKSRDGECGLVPMDYHGPTLRFSESTRIKDAK
jgi:replicative DNA helicase